MKLEQLNPQQREAVQTKDGPLLVLAGAGTGKTMVISWRIAYLVEQGVPPEQILAVTFTNRAAREMAERILALLPGVEPKRLTIGTFHAFCCRLLRAAAPRLGYDHRFGIADEGDQLGVIRQVIGELGYDRFPEAVDDYLAAISREKEQLHTPAQARATPGPAWQPRLAAVYERYQEHLRNMSLMDFDDLLYLVVQLWAQEPALLAAARDRYHYLLVDEFQDTNFAQAEILRQLAGERRNLCVVGDDDQSIYGWRGADLRNILEFPQQYPGAKVIKLEQNYRSTGMILTAANGVIAKNPQRHDKNLWSGEGSGETVRVVELADEEAEAACMAALVQELTARAGLRVEEIAVLFRANYQAPTLENAMRQAHLPYRVVGTKSFYERREIKDAVAYLRLALNPHDDLSLLRIINVPPRGLGTETIERLKAKRVELELPLLDVLRRGEFQATLTAGVATTVRAFLQEYDRSVAELLAYGGLADKVQRYLTRVGYLEGLKRIYRNHEDAVARREHLEVILREVARIETEQAGWPVNLQTFLEHYALVGDSERRDEHTDGRGGVTLLTVHAAKGLEFQAVMVVGLNQGVFPHDRALKENSLEEERRLFYVAVTRARRHLVLSHTRTRMVRKGGSTTPNVSRVSQFLEELPVACRRVCDAKTVLALMSREQLGSRFSALMAEMAARGNPDPQ